MRREYSWLIAGQVDAAIDGTGGDGAPAGMGSRREEEGGGGLDWSG